MMLRSLLRRKTFAATAVLSVGVGIGAATTILSLVIALFVRPLPYHEPEQLVAIWPSHAFALREVDALGRRMTSVTDIVSVSPGWLMPLTQVAVARQLDVARVDGDLFGLLGVAPLLGRPFAAAANDRVAVLSYDLWQSAFAGDRAIVGRSIDLSGNPYTVVAVMPKGFRVFAFTSDAWVSLPEDHSAFYWTGPTALVYARLRAGRTVRAASAEVATIAPQLKQEFQLAPDWGVGVQVVGLAESMVGTLRPMVMVLTGAVGFLLALATANVAILLLVRAAERRPEMGVRLALGATPRQLAALAMSESLAIGLAGGVIGVVLARAGIALVVGLLPPTLPRLQEITLNPRVLAAAAALTLLVTIVVGLASARHARTLQSRTLGPGGDRTRGLLVSLEMALAVLLVVGATLMGRTLMALSRVDLGLERDHLLTMRLQPEAHDDALRAYWQTLLARVQSVPGVRSAATILHLPTIGRAWDVRIAIEGQPLQPGQAPPEVHWQSVSAGYFQTAGVRVLRGRRFSDADGPRAPSVVAVNTAFAARFFPGADPIGRRVSVGWVTNDSLATIVAVVGSVRHDSLTGAPPPELYSPFAQRPVGANSLIVRTSVPPQSLVRAIRHEIEVVNPNVPISDVMTMDDLLAASVARQRTMLIIFTLFAIVGLALGAIGVYGVVAFGAAQRVKEVGIRMALGANTGAIQRLLVRHGFQYAALGATVGTALALALSRLMRNVVYGVPTTDPVAFVAAPAILAAVVAIASWIPARRAATVDPTVAIRDGASQ
jgi:putative ABC transport system permease protein